MTITYRYGDNLYVNVTNRCPNACEFCLRATGDKVGDSGSLWFEYEPTKEEIWDSIQQRDLTEYRQLVFCGFGEPACRLEEVLWVCQQVRAVSPIPIRINTNGLSDLIHKKPTAPLFAGNFDMVSVSLNAPTPEKYDALCHSEYGLAALPAVLKFTREVTAYVPYVRMTVVDTMPPKDLEECRRLCEETGAKFEVRHYEPDWQDSPKI